MDARILRITAAGAGLLNRVEADVFDHEIDPRHLAAYLADPGHLLVCAVADGVVIGQARGVITRQPDAPPALYIDNLGVAEARRREGIASRLLGDLTDWGRANGCAVARVGTALGNGPARALSAGRGAEMQAVAYCGYALDEA